MPVTPGQFGYLPEKYKDSTERREVRDGDGERVEAVNTEHWSGRVDLELRPESIRSKLIVPGHVINQRDMSITPSPARGVAGVGAPFGVPDVAPKTKMIPIDMEVAEDLMARIKRGAN